MRNPRWLNSSSAACRGEDVGDGPGDVFGDSYGLRAQISRAKTSLPVPSQNRFEGARGLCSEMTCSGSAE